MCLKGNVNDRAQADPVEGEQGQDRCWGLESH